MMKKRVSVVGIGKLGACMAAAIAARGHETIGVDVEMQTVEALQQKRPPVFEPGLAELMAGSDGRLRGTRDHLQTIQQTDITFVVVPTPSNSDGGFSLRFVCEAMEQIGQALRHKSSYHLVVLTSTVLPGSTDYVVRPLLEEASGKQCGRDFGLCYSPEFIALGSVIRDFLNPDFLLIGECEEAAGNELAAFYRDSMGIEAPAARMSPVNAELTKIALNSYVTTKITFANLLAEVCERLPGGDVDAVTSALGLDSRIGAKYLKGGLGYGGPCFPRDNQALAHFLDRIGVSAELPRTVDKSNRNQPERVLNLIRRLIPDQCSKVAVFGLAFKANTNVVEESQGIEIARRLAQSGYSVVVFDPVAMEAASKVLGSLVAYGGSVPECLIGSAAVVVASDLPELVTIIRQLYECSARPVLIDAWRVFRSKLRPDALPYKAIGMGQADGQAEGVLRQFVQSLVHEKALKATTAFATEEKAIRR
jgi:UDPglucose 6-dehydrogenase